MALDKKQELKNTLPGGAQNAQTSAAATPYRAQETQNNGNNKINEASDAPAYSPYKGLPGLSNTTAANMGKYQQGYTASDAVNQAQAYLDNLLNNKPSDYASNYTQQLNDLYGQIMNRDPFQYNLNEDMLYQQVKDQYMLTGQQAMMDTMGQAAALSGGYGSSYASTAGNQALQSYLQRLSELVPELYGAAYERYMQEGQELQNMYAITQAADQADYARYQDTYNNWLADRSYAQSAYQSAQSADYADYANRLNMAGQILGMEQSDYADALNRAFQTSEREASQQYYADQDAINRLWQEQQTQNNQNWQSAQNQIERDWQAQQTQQNQNWQASQNAAERDWQAQQTQQNQNWQAQQNQLDRDYNTQIRNESYQREDAQRVQDYAYELSMNMIGNGVLPTDDVLAAAGISSTDALALAKKNGYGKSSGGGSSGGSTKASAGTTSSKTSASSGNSIYDFLVGAATGAGSGLGNAAAGASNVASNVVNWAGNLLNKLRK